MKENGISPFKIGLEASWTQRIGDLKSVSGVDLSTTALQKRRIMLCNFLEQQD